MLVLLAIKVPVKNLAICLISPWKEEITPLSQRFQLFRSKTKRTDFSLFKGMV